MTVILTPKSNTSKSLQVVTFNLVTGFTINDSDEYEIQTTEPIGTEPFRYEDYTPNVTPN